MKWAMLAHDNSYYIDNGEAETTCELVISITFTNLAKTMPFVD